MQMGMGLPQMQLGMPPMMAPGMGFPGVGMVPPPPGMGMPMPIGFPMGMAMQMPMGMGMPGVQPPQMREPPWFAVFKDVDIRELEYPRNIFVYAVKKGTEFKRPADNKLDDPDAPLVGCQSIFFFDVPGGCANCKVNPILQIAIDITQGLRDLNLRPSEAVLHVLVESADGEVKLREETPVPEPKLKGPRFTTMSELLSQEKKDEAVEDIKELQKILEGLGETDAGTVGGDWQAAGGNNGDFGPMTEAAIKNMQKKAGLKEDGVAGPLTKRALLSSGLHKDDLQVGEKLKADPGSTVTWSLASDNVPVQLTLDKLVEELQSAFDQWGEAANLKFKQAESSAKGDIAIDFSNCLGEGEDTTYDGPGGALANATPSSITFDSNERWELQCCPHPHRKFMDWDEMFFYFLPVAIHEIGHVLGLCHSTEPTDVMSPYYIRDRVKLSAGDVARVKEIWCPAS